MNQSFKVMPLYLGLNIASAKGPMEAEIRRIGFHAMAQ